MTVRLDKKKIPIPSATPKHKRRGRPKGVAHVLYPFGELKVGYSFTAPAKAAIAAGRFKARGTIEGWDYTVRKISKDRVRIWRTA